MESTSHNNHLIAGNIRDRIHKNARQIGIKKWDLGASYSNDSSVQIDKGTAKQLRSSQRSSITIRVWNEQGLVGITSTSDLSDSGLNKALRGAEQASDFGNASESPDFSPLAKAQLPTIDRPLINSQGINKLFSIIKDAEQELLGKHNAINNVPYNGISESNSERLYLNSDGAIRHQRRTNACLYLYARAEEAGRKPRSSGSVRLAYGSQRLDITGCIEEAARKTISHLNYAPITTGKYLVCFTPEAFLDLLGAFSSLFNARAILDGVSLSSKDSIGNQISVPFLNLNDNGLHKDNHGATSFDGEGSPTCNLSLIRNGKIQNFLHSEATARAFGVKPTGHAGLGAKVSVGPDWFEISKSDEVDSYSKALSHTTYNEEFVLIQNLNALHAGVKSSQGSFSLPFDGWIVKGQEKISIEAATVAGDIKNVLNNILNVEAEKISTTQGVSPHIWVENLSITGEA